MSKYFNDVMRFLSGVPNKYRNLLLNENLEVRNKEQQKFKDLLSDLIGGKFWAISVLGTVGNGKTTISCAAINAWNDFFYFYDNPAYYTTQSSLINEVKGSFDTKGVSESAIFNKYAKAKLLVIDELNLTDWSEYNKNLIQKILVDRYANDRKTVLIGNLTAEQFKGMFDDHVISRLREGQTLFMTEKDMRVKEEIA